VGQIRVGVVGLGAFGRHHAKHYAAHGGARLAALADVDIGRAEHAVAAYGGEAFADHRQLIGKVDAVSVAAPATHHARIAADLIDAGIHVLVEKPLATDAVSARDLVGRAERDGVVLQVGHIERYSPVVAELRRRVVAPLRITAVRRAVWSERASDVDVVLDMMIHDIDHALAFAGAPVATVSASGAVRRSASTDEAEAWLTFANGVIATLSASRVAARQERRLTIGEAGGVFAADLARDALAISARSGPGLAEMITPPRRDCLAAEIAAFIEAVRNGGRPEADGGAGLAAVEVAEWIRAAIDEPAAPVRALV